MARTGPAEQPGGRGEPVADAAIHRGGPEESDLLEREGSEHFELGKDATEDTDSYVLTTVFFATVLFFAGISMRFAWQPMRVTVLVLATASLVYAVVMIARLPTL